MRNKQSDKKGTGNGQTGECQCPYCNRYFATQDELTLHIVTRHTQTGLKRGGPAQAGSGSQ
jgi:hypothetical protein